jgi:hypothetical protein
LRRSTSQSGTYTTIATLPANTTTYTNTGLINGRKYYYKVRAINSAGNSAYSNTASATASCTTLKSGELAESADLNSETVTESIKLFPNPVYGGWFNLNLSAETKLPVKVSINSITGQKVLQRELNNYNNIIETIGLKNGMYILTVQSKGDIHKLKLQINK